MRGSPEASQSRNPKSEAVAPKSKNPKRNVGPSETLNPKPERNQCPLCRTFLRSPPLVPSPPEAPEAPEPRAAADARRRRRRRSQPSRHRRTCRPSGTGSRQVGGGSAEAGGSGGAGSRQLGGALGSGSAQAGGSGGAGGGGLGTRALGIIAGDQRHKGYKVTLVSLDARHPPAPLLMYHAMRMSGGREASGGMGRGDMDCPEVGRHPEGVSCAQMGETVWWNIYGGIYIRVVLMCLMLSGLLMCLCMVYIVV